MLNVGVSGESFMDGVIILSEDEGFIRMLTAGECGNTFKIKMYKQHNLNQKR